MVFLWIRPGSLSPSCAWNNCIIPSKHVKTLKQGSSAEFSCFTPRDCKRPHLSSTRRSSPVALSQGVLKRTKRVHWWRALTRVYDVPFWYLPTFKQSGRRRRSRSTNWQKRSGKISLKFLAGGFPDLMVEAGFRLSQKLPTDVFI